MKTFDSTRFVWPSLSHGRHRARTLATVACAMVLAGIGSACTEAIPGAPVAAVNFPNPVDSVLVGKTFQLNVTVKDGSGNVLTGRKVTFASQQPAVAEPDASGLVTTKLGDQSAILTATVEGKVATMTLRVLQPVSKLVLAPASNEVTIGSTRQLLPTLTAASGVAIPGRVLSWTTSNPAVATVTGAGVVSAIGLGQATITATSNIDNVSGTATFNVTDPITQVRLSPSTPQLLRVGGTLQVTATALNAAGQTISGRPVTWISGNPGVVTVSNTGLVTAIGVGTTSITAEIEGHTAQVNVTVTEIPPRSVTLSPTAFTLTTGTNRQLIPVVVDSAGTTVTSLATRQVSWQTSNPAVANVSSTGVITAAGSGTALISVTVDGFKSNEVTVTVDAVVASIRLSPFLPQTLRIGGSVQISATPLDNNNQPVPGKTVNWFTSNPAVASVSATGLVTAVGVGSTTITAEVDGKISNISVTVTLVRVGSVTVVPTTDTLIVGDTRQYVPVVRDTANQVIASTVGRNVNWQSSDALVANVSPLGVTNATAVGVTTLSLTVDGVQSNTLQLTVEQVGSVTVTPNPGSVRVGQGLQLTVVVKDASGNAIRISKQSLISFSSSAPGIASVSPFGLVNGLAAGTVVISANVNGVVGQTTVNVVP